VDTLAKHHAARFQGDVKMMNHACPPEDSMWKSVFDVRPGDFYVGVFCSEGKTVSDWDTPGLVISNEFPKIWILSVTRRDVKAYNFNSKVTHLCVIKSDA
jgi:hypothetical protein